MIELHPYNNREAIPAGTSTLIIGTAPPLRFSNPRPTAQAFHSGDVDFYYGSKDNLIWREIIPRLFPEAFDAGAEPCADSWRSFLRGHAYWMHDIYSEYSRLGYDALDQNLRPTRAADLRDILDTHSTINNLIFTGRAAESFSGKQLESQGVIAQYLFGSGGVSGKKMPRGRHLTLVLPRGQREIQTFTVPSPSRTTLRRYSLDEICEIYRSALGLRNVA